MANHDSSSTTTVCGQCGIADQKILHHVRHRGTFRRLCTTCVLRLHPQSFCSYCLTVYESSPPENTVACYKCYSNSHCACVSPPVTGPTPFSRPRTPCFTCVNPDAIVFDPKTAGIDLPAARLLLAAAEISSSSIRKAEVAAVAVADQRAKDASDTRKAAKEALYRLAKRTEIERKKSAVTDVEVKNSKLIASNEVSDALNAVKLADETTACKVESDEDVRVQN